MSYEVIAATSYWAMNGVNIFSANLVRGLQARGVRSRILMTEQNSALINVNEPMMPVPEDIPVERLPLRGKESWGAHWGAMIRYLEEHAPCVYIPNHDWRHSNVSPLLSPAVRIAGVVHSDDPLHYDHVARLGRFWDAIVTTSDAIAQQVILRNPLLAGRVRPIPIGVPVPDSPILRDRSAGPLRLVYQGGLIQYQKRVFDLPKIVEEALRLGIPVELTLIGDGTERARLETASRHLVENGAVRFLGVVAHARLMELLREFDVYLLTSEFEGMPNALGEAMARGCIPIVTDIRSGVRELVRHEDSGFVVPVGDIAAFARHLARLHRDPELRRTMSENAREAVIRGGFSVQTMVDRYLALFESLFAPETAGRFQRPQACLRMPPYQVKRVKTFEMRHVHWFGNPGVLPSPFSDYQDFRRELRGTGRKLPFWPLKRGRPYPNVVVSATSGRVSGVDVFSANLVRGLRELGREAYVLMTSPGAHAPDPMPFPADVPVKKLGVSRWIPSRIRWQILRRYLERKAPCIYIPNYDWNYSGISPVLSAKVATVGIVHSDDPVHYEHVARLGHYWNSIVAVSDAIARRIIELDPSLAPRVVTIPYGVEAPAAVPERMPAPDGALRIVYAGRLVQEQKRVLDIAKIFEALANRGVPAQLTMIGSGQEEQALKAALDPWIHAGRVHFPGTLSNREVLRTFAESDVVLLTSEFEGLPVSLLEAMAQGCVPVVSDIPSGIPDLVRQGETGFRVPVGDTQGFADCLTKLQADPPLRQTLSEASHRTVSSGYSTEDMITAYMGLFERVLVEAEVGEYQRPPGAILPPPRASVVKRFQGWPAGDFLDQLASAAARHLGW